MLLASGAAGKQHRLMGSIPKESWKRYFLRLGLLSAGFYAALLAVLFSVQDRLIFQGAYTEPPFWYEATGLETVLKGEAVPTEDGRAAFVLHAPPLKDRPVVIVFHGNASYPEDYLPVYEALLKDGIGIVAPALRGYPRSPGQPSERGMMADARSVYRWTIKKHPGSKIYLLGHSLGSGVAVRLAGESEVAGLVLVSPYLSMSSLVWERMPFLPVRLLLKSTFRSDLSAGSVKAPVLVFHGDADWTVPIRSGRKLFTLFPNDKEFVTVKGAGHNEGMFEADTVESIRRFIERK